MRGERERERGSSLHLDQSEYDVRFTSGEGLDLK
jgi:hypothetical protein